MGWVHEGTKERMWGNVIDRKRMPIQGIMGRLVHVGTKKAGVGNHEPGSRGHPHAGVGDHELGAGPGGIPNHQPQARGAGLPKSAGRSLNHRRSRAEDLCLHHLGSPKPHISGSRARKPNPVRTQSGQRGSLRRLNITQPTLYIG